jgi:exosome complex component RRP4
LWNTTIVADVQSFFADGSMALQVTRAQGKLENGLFVRVPPSLMKRSKTHFNALPMGIDAILGINGYIWLTPTLSDEEKDALAAAAAARKPDSASASASLPPPSKPVSPEVRERLARVRNVIQALVHKFLPISPDTIVEVYKQSIKFAPKDLLKPDIVEQITKTVAFMT